VTEASRPAGRKQLLLLAAIFIGPLLIAFLLYFKGAALQPEGRTNHGELLEPIVAIRDSLPESPLLQHTEEHWVLLYANERACDERCRESLHALRQTRLMIGREMDRVQRVFLHGAEPPDTVFLDAEHKGLAVIRDEQLSGLLRDKRPQQLAPGGLYLIDPLSNVVLYFSPDVDPQDVVSDVKRLLKLSRIG
jgi:hypothetical protein